MIKHLSKKLRIKVTTKGQRILIDTETRYTLIFFPMWRVRDRLEIELRDIPSHWRGSMPSILRINSFESPFNWNLEIWSIKTFNLESRIKRVIAEIDEYCKEQRAIDKRIKELFK